jgi:hypothetical protein
MQQVHSNTALPLDVESLAYKIYIKTKYINTIFVLIFLYFIIDRRILEKYTKTCKFLYKY